VNQDISSRSPWATRLVLLAAAVLFCWNLWGYDLWAPDEPYFGEGAREMLVDGHWLVPHVDGAVTTDKPPLFFWLVALMSMPFGRIHEWSARLPSLLAALAVLALTMRLARSWWDERTAAVTGWVLMSTLLFWRQARSAQIDAVLCFFIVAALWAFARFRAGEMDGRYAGWIFWAAIALGTLAKGPIALLLPLLIALATLGVDRNLRRWREFAPVSGPLLFILMTGTWAALTLIEPSGYSVFGALQRHFLERAMHGLDHVQPPWYYLESMPVSLLPWTGPAIAGLVLAWRRRQDARLRFLFVWVVTVIAVFSISTEKRDLYVLPALPALALLSGRFMTALDIGSPASDGRPSRRWFSWSLVVVGGVLTAVGVALPVLIGRHPLPVDVHRPALILSLVMIPGGVWMIVAALRVTVMRATAATVIVIGALYLIIAGVVYPTLNPMKSVREVAEQLPSMTASYRESGHSIVTYGLGNVPRAIAFYSNGIYLRRLSSREELIAALSRPGTVWGVIDGSTLEALPDSMRGSIRLRSVTKMSRRSVNLIEKRAVP
jgi:4-amino-4-deoxy-L-arabinose transferase-like glycosyltransferase